MSSHVLSEVQQTADRVGIVRDGKMVAVEQVETLRERAMPMLEIRFESPVPREAFDGLPNVQEVVVDGAVLRCRVHGTADALVKTAARFTVVSIRANDPNLEELFFTYYQTKEAGRAA
jgi:ABC-2 type transport system ATP-binding protein